MGIRDLIGHKAIFFALTAIALLLGCFGFWKAQPQQLNLFKNGLNSGYFLDTYSDTELDGNSSISFSDTSNQLRYNFNLGTRYEYPFVGFYFQDTSGALSDFTVYNNIKIKFSEEVPSLVSLAFQRYINHPDITQTYIYQLRTVPEKNTYLVPIGEFKTPLWWFRENENLGVKGALVPDSIVSFNIDHQEEYNHPVVIEAITFGQNTNYFWLYIIIAVYLIFVVMRVLLKPRKSVIRHEIKISLDEVNTNKTTYYLQENFTNRDISLQSAAAHLKITEVELEENVKSSTGLKFKDYLNVLRIEFAKQLLLETDDKSFEIATKSGFNNAANFSQVFKSLTGTTPNKYRKTKK